MAVNYSTRVIKDIGKLSSDGVCIYDLEAKAFIYFNKCFRQIVETTSEKLKGKSLASFEKLIRNDQGYAELHAADFLKKGKIQNVELRLSFPSRSKFVSVDAFLTNEGRHVIAFVRDLTLTKQHFDYIVEFGARKDTILDMVAHNLSGPLNLTTELINQIDQLNKTQQYRKIDNYTRIIRESTQKCIEVINSFLDEEHLESEKIVAKQNLFDVVAKVKIVVDRFRQLNKSKEFKLVSDKKELMVRADDVKFFQIVHNLISNAVKFTRDKGTITTIIKDDEHFFEVSVSDNGIGIPEHLQPYIFQRNTPAAREGLKGEKSIGMGLYIVSKLTKILKGKITLDTEENAGSTFRVRLPKG